MYNFIRKKIIHEAHMLFQYLCGFKPIFYFTHPNEEPLIIDLLNDKELAKGIDGTEGLRGISKLEQWIKNADVSGFEEHITFLRNLWDLRSSGVGHAKGKSYKKASQKFAIEETPLQDVFDKILQSADSYLSYMIDNFT